MTYLIVLPSIWPNYTAACLYTMHPAVRAPMVVDNAAPEENRGVAASWNLGRAAVLERRLDWLVVLSAAIRFGDHGGRDFIAALDAPEYTDARAIEGGDNPGAHTGLGWHLIAFRRETLATVGPFDEIFWPAYWEDNDWSMRYQVAYDCYKSGQLWPKPPVDAVVAKAAHGIQLAHVEVDFVKNRIAYEQKWLGPPGHERTSHPYGDPSLPITFTGPYKSWHKRAGEVG